MSNKIPSGISAKNIVAAIRDLDRGVSHAFGASTGYDVLYKERRYPPKAVIGLATGKLTGKNLGPYDFHGGLKSKCFRVLEANGFTIVTKGEIAPFPDELDKGKHIEGAVQRALVNRYERDAKARAKCIQYYGPKCQVCGFDFKRSYGMLGEGFIHVHHTVPLSRIRKTYTVDPINDLRPVCPNCHAMLHKRVPPYSIDELRKIIKERKRGG